MNSSQRNDGFTPVTVTETPMNGPQLRKEARAWLPNGGGTYKIGERVQSDAEIWARIQAEKQKIKQAAARARAAVRS